MKHFEKFYKTDFDGISIVDNGKYLYVSNGSIIKSYEFWGKYTHPSNRDLDIGKEEIPWEEYGHLECVYDGQKIRLQGQFPVSGNWIFLDNHRKCIWVVSNTKLRRVELLENGQMAICDVCIWANGLDIPEHICNPCFVDDKIYFLKKIVGDELYQKVYSVNVDTQQILYGDFSTQRQNVRSDIAYDYNGHIYYTCWNSGGVMKYDMTNIANPLSFIPINANPYKIRTNLETRKLYIASYGGMISTLDINGVVTHAHSTAQKYTSIVENTENVKINGNETAVSISEETGEPETTISVVEIDGNITHKNSSVTIEMTTQGEVNDFAFDNNNMWYLAIGDGEVSLGKLNLSNNTHQFTPLTTLIKKATNSNDEDESFTLNLENILNQRDYYIKDLSDVDKIKVYITQQFNYQYWNGNNIISTTVNPYLVVLGSSSLFLIRLNNELCTGMKYSLLGHHMITESNFDYKGDFNSKVFTPDIN